MEYFDIDEISKDKITSTNLTELADYYETDKGTSKHNYTPIYQNKIGHLKNIDLLELGIYKGSSLKMWASFFVDSKIHGVDINTKCSQFCKDFDNINIIIDDLHNSFTPTQTFDVIIDDASHLPQYIISVFEKLWKNVKPGGYYIIEDTDMCSKIKYVRMIISRYNLSTGETLSQNLKNNTKKVLLEFIETLQTRDDIEEVYIPNKKLCFIQKKKI